MNWLRLNISQVCNFSCKYCHVFKMSQKTYTPPLMSYKTMDKSVQKVMQLLATQNTDSLIISIYGGETLINKKNLFRLINKYNDSYLNIKILWILNTNGSLLKKEDVLFLKKYNVDIHISCDGYKRINDINRRDKFDKGTFERIKEALSLIKKYKAKAQINSFVSPMNINNLKDIVNIAFEYNIKRIYLDFLYFPKVKLSTEKIRDKYIEVYKYGLKKGIKISGPWGLIIKNIFRKDYKRKKEISNKLYFPSIQVNPDETFFFQDYPLSKRFNLKIDHLEEIFNSSEYPLFFKSIKNYFSKECKNCFLFQFCKGRAITQYQYHTQKKEGYSNTCEIMKEIITKILLLKKKKKRKHLKKMVYFKITSLCNLKCDFCETKKSPEFLKKEIQFTQKNLSKFEEFFNGLNGQWEIFIGGGEPFIIPEFLNFINNLAKTGHKISIVTNFTSSLDKLKKFCNLTGRKLNLFLASFKPQVHNFNEFLDKSKIINNLIKKNKGIFSVGALATKKDIDFLFEAGKTFKKNGIQFNLQAERINGRYRKYCSEDIKKIKYFKRTYGVENNFNFKGKICFAGVNYFILLPNGDAFICHSALTSQNQDDYLGNIFRKNFKLHKYPTICKYNCCVCINAYNKGIIY